MTKLYNKTGERDKRRELRNNSTETESLLWRRLRNQQVLGFKFRRQYGVGAFVLDFYCPILKLAIEIDGLSHEGEEVEAYDKSRQAFIESFGIQFIRFTNEQVYRQLEGVVLQIEQKVQELSTPSQPPPY